MVIGSVLSLTSLLLLAGCFVWAFGTKHRVEVEIFSCKTRRTVSIGGHDLVHLPYQPDTASAVSATFPQGKAGHSVYLESKDAYWVPASWESYCVISGLAGLVTHSAGWGYNPRGRPMTTEAKKRLVNNTLYIWKQSGLNAAGSYLTKVNAIFYKSYPQLRDPGTQPIQVSEIEEPEQFLKTHTQSDDWLQFFSEG